MPKGVRSPHDRYDAGTVTGFVAASNVWHFHPTMPGKEAVADRDVTAGSEGSRSSNSSSIERSMNSI